MRRGIYKNHGAARLFRILVLLCGVSLGTWPAAAQQGTSMPLLPTQPAEAAPPMPAVIAVFGDSQAQGLAMGLQRVLVEDPRYKVLNRTHPGAALVHAENEWLGPAERFAAREQADIAVVMFGANDRLDLRESGAYLRFRSDEWRAAYAARVDRILDALSKTGMRVIWCGNPIARSETYSTDMSYINGIFAEETARYGAQFVPLWSVITDEQGRFTAYGKDRGGTTQRMRTDDGIHFTSPGYELIAEKIVTLLSSTAANALQTAPH